MIVKVQRREGSCRCPYEIKGISAQIPDDESLSAGPTFLRQLQRSTDNKPLTNKLC